VDDRSIRDAVASGVSAVNVTLGYVSGPMDPFEYTVGSIGAWDRLLRERADHLVKVNTADDILRARREGKVGVFYGSRTPCSWATGLSGSASSPTWACE
jgi:membrane dipeptidase